MYSLGVLHFHDLQAQFAGLEINTRLKLRTIELNCDLWESLYRLFRCLDVDILETGDLYETGPSIIYRTGTDAVKAAAALPLQLPFRFHYKTAAVSEVIFYSRISTKITNLLFRLQRDGTTRWEDHLCAKKYADLFSSLLQRKLLGCNLQATNILL